MNSSLIKEILAPIFQKYPQVGVVYLFGSQATGVADARSDFDFAVYFNESDILKRHDTLFTLSGELSRALNTDKIDIHTLNDIQSPTLKYHIMQEGIVLFEREPYRIFLEPRILNEYNDFLYMLRKYHLTKV